MTIVRSGGIGSNTGTDGDGDHGGVPGKGSGSGEDPDGGGDREIPVAATTVAVGGVVGVVDVDPPGETLDDVVGGATQAVDDVVDGAAGTVDEARRRDHGRARRPPRWHGCLGPPG